MRLIFVKFYEYLLIKYLPSTQNAVHKELETILKSHSFESLKNAFVVVEPGKHRFRKLPTTKK